MMKFVAIVVNGAEPKSVYAPFVLGTSGLAVGNEGIIFFCLAGGTGRKAGELEKVTDKGMPDMKNLLKRSTDWWKDVPVRPWMVRRDTTLLS